MAWPDAQSKKKSFIEENAAPDYVYDKLQRVQTPVRVAS